MDSALELDYARDIKYRKYVLSVDKILQSFDAIEEWADIITFYAKFTKMLQSFPQYASVPFKVTVAKRLAQCLNPALPAGVHQKTLEVYDLIFEKIKSNQLSFDLVLYGAGLFPAFQYSTLSVKPTFLTLYQTHLVPLKKSLAPGLKSFLLSVLPELEEENSEHSDKVLSLLDDIRTAVGDDMFYGALWKCLIDYAPTRVAVVNFMLKKLPRLPPSDLMKVYGAHHGLLLASFCIALKDDQLLVQRGLLDILIVHFPMKSLFLSVEQQAHLLESMLLVLLRRDISLTRRIYAWIFGSVSINTLDDKDYNKSHFDTVAKAPLTLALQTLFKADFETSQEMTKPYRIMMSLLDRSDVGIPMTEALVVDILRSFHRSSQQPLFQSELLTVMNMFLRMVDEEILWRRVIDTVRTELDPEHPCHGNQKVSDPSSSLLLLDLLQPMLARVKWDTESLEHCLPSTLLHLFSLHERTRTPDHRALLEHTVLAILRVLPATVLHKPLVPTDTDTLYRTVLARTLSCIHRTLPTAPLCALLTWLVNLPKEAMDLTPMLQALSATEDSPLSFLARHFQSSVTVFHGALVCYTLLWPFTEKKDCGMLPLILSALWAHTTSHMVLLRDAVAQLHVIHGDAMDHLIAQHCRAAHSDSALCALMEGLRVFPFPVTVLHVLARGRASPPLHVLMARHGAPLVEVLCWMLLHPALQRQKDAACGSVYLYAADIPVDQIRCVLSALLPCVASLQRVLTQTRVSERVLLLLGNEEGGDGRAWTVVLEGLWRMALTWDEGVLSLLACQWLTALYTERQKGQDMTDEEACGEQTVKRAMVKKWMPLLMAMLLLAARRGDALQRALLLLLSTVNEMSSEGLPALLREAVHEGLTLEVNRGYREDWMDCYAAWPLSSMDRAFIANCLFIDAPPREEEDVLFALRALSVLTVPAWDRTTMYPCVVQMMQVTSSVACSPLDTEARQAALSRWLSRRLAWADDLAITALIETWSIMNHDRCCLLMSVELKDNVYDNRVLDALHSLFNPVTVITTAFQCLSASALYGTASSSSSLSLSSLHLLRFIEVFLQRTGMDAERMRAVNGPLLLSNAWQSRKERASQGTETVRCYTALLRVFYTMVSLLARTEALQDRKLLRDLQDVYQRLVSLCMMSTTTEEEVENETQLRVFYRAWLLSLSETSSSTRPSVMQCDPTLERLSVLRMTFVPLTLFLWPNVSTTSSSSSEDAERDRVVLPLVHGLMYYMVGPVLKRSSHAAAQAVRCVQRTTVQWLCDWKRLPFTLRAWKKEVWEALQDAAFFEQWGAAEALSDWAQLLDFVVAQEPERLEELLGKLSIHQAAAMFITREQEALTKAAMLKRVAFLLFAASERDRYVKALPLLQEKLVAYTRSASSVLQREVILTLRVLFVRYAQRHLRALWPLTTAELVRVLVEVFNANERQQVWLASDLALALAVCQWMDQMVCQNLEDFQFYEWLLVNDADKARDHREAVTQEEEDTEMTTTTMGREVVFDGTHGLLDALTQAWRALGKLSDDASSRAVAETCHCRGTGKRRRPILHQRDIATIHELDAFFVHLGEHRANLRVTGWVCDDRAVDKAIERDFTEHPIEME